VRLLPIVSLLLLAACGSGGDTPPRPDHPADLPPSPREQREARAAAQRPPAPRCPPGGGNCATAQGRVIALESVDPDGDGDLHLILLGGSITAPGISVLDVNKDLRPKVDPKVGDWAAGAGPVYPGSHRQRQIQVTAVEVWPRR
jgi:hypothetical protein